MRIRILDRILVALAGVLLVAACAGLVGQVFFGLDVVGFLSKLLTVESTTGKVVIGACAFILLILGLYCLLVLFRHRKRKDKFVLQKMESGELAISLKTLETMVQKCLDQHKEIKVENIRLENQRDGLLIRIQGIVAGGISIPLTVDTLQKQVKQYVTACSGVEVKGIRLQIEASGEDAPDAPFAIEPPTNPLLPKGGSEAAPTEEEPEIPNAETEQEGAGNEAETIPEPEKPLSGEEAAAAAAMAAAESLMMNEAETEEDDRPIHQRLFSIQEEPCIMPLPPENLNIPETDPTEKKEEDAEKTDEAEIPKEEPEQPAETDKAAEEAKGEENV